MLGGVAAIVVCVGLYLTLKPTPQDVAGWFVTGCAFFIDSARWAWGVIAAGAR